MFQGNRLAQLTLRWATIALTAVLLAPIAASGYSNLDDSSEPLASLSKLVPRIGRSIGDDNAFFKAAKSLPRIGKRVNNNEIFPGVRRLLKPLPRVGRSSHDGDDNFMLKGLLTSDVFKDVGESDFEPHRVVRRSGTTDQQRALLEPDFLKGFKALPRIGRRDGPTDQSDSHLTEDSESHHGENKRVPPALLTQAGSWNNGDIPWFRQQDGPLFPSKKSGLADLVRLSALPWEDAVMKEKPQEVPLAVVTLADDRDVPDAWHYNVISDSDHRLE